LNITSTSAEDFGGRPIWLVGATGTLGAAMARLLSERGAVLALSGRRADALDELARSLPGEAIAVPVDLYSETAVLSAAADIKSRLGAIGSLVVSVTVSGFGEFLQLPEQAFADAMETKYMGSLRAMRAVLPDMTAQRYGRIVTISGGSGSTPRPVHMPGGAANAALELLSRGVAMRYANEGVRCNIIAPGPIASPRMQAIVAASDAAKQGDGDRPAGQPADVAEAVCYLLSARSTFINGTVLKVDGGPR
jgi:NAD(P)-dependent dehydrogenase (short-subunit alcohol dehydrogenase family)